MQIDLSGKTAFISGSTKGIGKATAISLAGCGARVIVHGRDQAEAESVAGKIDGASAVAGDLSSDQSTNQLVAQLERTGPVDILVNNAGVYSTKPFPKIADEDWQQIFDINVMSGVRLTRALLPGMLERNWGRVIFISSESALNIPVEMVHYGMTKAAQLAIARGVAETTKGTGVTVNSVLPGPTRTEGVMAALQKAAGEDADLEKVEKVFLRQNRPTTLLDRLATVEEVAAMITYVASPQASATNGAALRVDGGVVKYIV